MNEILMSKIWKIATVTFAWAWIQVSDMVGGIISEGFDNLFSLGLLLFIAYLLWQERQAAQEYNQERDGRIERLVESNTEAINDFRRSNDALTTAIQELRKDISEIK